MPYLAVQHTSGAPASHAAAGAPDSYLHCLRGGVGGGVRAALPCFTPPGWRRLRERDAGTSLVDHGANATHSR